MSETGVVVRPLQLPPPSGSEEPLLLDADRQAPPDPDMTEWQDILRGDFARRIFEEHGEERYVGYILGRLAASQSPELRRYASMPLPGRPSSGVSSFVVAPAQGGGGQGAPSKPQAPSAHDIKSTDTSRSPGNDTSAQNVILLPPAQANPAEIAARDERIREALGPLTQARDSLARITARQRMSHNAALLEQSRTPTRRQKLIRSLGYLMIPWDARDEKQARADEVESDRASADYRRSLEEYVQAVGGDLAQRNETRRRMMDEFEGRVRYFALQSMQPPQPQANQVRPGQAQGAARGPQQVPPAQSAPRQIQYRPSGLTRSWIESSPRKRAAAMAITAGVGAAAISGVLVVAGTPLIVTGIAGFFTSVAARSAGAYVAVRTNRHRFVSEPVRAAHEAQAAARNRDFIQSAPQDEQLIDVTRVYRRATLQYSGEALTEKRRAEKAAGIGAAVGFIAVQVAANLFKVVAEYGPFAPKQPLPSASPTHSVAPTPTASHAPTPTPAHGPTPTPTPNTTPTPTPTPTPGTPGTGGPNYSAWPWDLAKQLGSKNPLQSVQDTINHLNASGGHYGLIHQANGKEWVEQMVNGKWTPLSPDQQLRFNHEVASVLGVN